MSDVQPSERLQGEEAMISDRKGDDNRVTLQALTDKIRKKKFVRFNEDGVSDGGILTQCILTMQNGFFVTGQSAPAYPNKFDADLGQQLAYDDALRKAWQLEGYLLCEKRWKETGQPAPGIVQSPEDDVVNEIHTA